MSEGVIADHGGLKWAIGNENGKWVGRQSGWKRKCFLWDKMLGIGKDVYLRTKLTSLKVSGKLLYQDKIQAYVS